MKESIDNFVKCNPEIFEGKTLEKIKEFKRIAEPFCAFTDALFAMRNSREEKDMDKKEATLKDTCEMMNSTDYKDRFRAEYMQTVIRYKKLKTMLDKWDNGDLDFVTICPRSIYNIQIRAMADYIAVLEARAVMEGIDLREVL